jgi:hypothetical protein
MAARCSAIARSGSRCNSPVLPESKWCWVHDPAAADRRREASKKGGKARSNQARAAKQLPPAFTSPELLAVLSGAIRKVEAGEIAPGVVNAMANAARAMNSIREMTEVEARLAELEARAGVVDTRWRA